MEIVVKYFLNKYSYGEKRTCMVKWFQKSITMQVVYAICIGAKN